MTEEVEVVEVFINGTPEKGLNGFRVPVTYLLADGRTIDTAYTSRLKRNVLPGAADLDARAKKGGVAASFVDGKFIATVIHYRLGGAT